MSAVFSIIEGIIEAILAVIEAIATGIQAIIEVIPTVFEGIAQVVGVIPQVIEGIGQVVEGMGQVIPNQLVLYIFWFVIEASFVAFFPVYALLITVGFFIFTIYGLLQGVGDILGAPTAVVAALAFAALAGNAYLVLTIG